MNAESEIFQEIKGLTATISKIDKKVEVLIQREQPAKPCRDEIDKKYNDLDNKIIGFQGGIAHTINDVKEKVNKKVGYKYFWTAIIGSGSVIVGTVWKIIDIVIK
jgi:hypothetical protein